MDIITRGVSPVSVNNVSKTENRLGSECTGATGATNRVLTLANTALSYNVLVYFDGLALHNSKVIVTNNATSSTIQFLVPVDDDNLIVATYIA